MQNYGIISEEGEQLSIYLLGRGFDLITDHRPLVTILENVLNLVLELNVGC